MDIGIAFQGMLIDMEELNRRWNDVGATFLEVRDELVELCENVRKIMKFAIFGETQEDESDEQSDSVTQPKKYGVSLRRPPRATSIRYNYIPSAPRNLPYQRRAY